MAARFIIDDRDGSLYADFTARRKTSASTVLAAERGLSPTVDIFLVNVPTDGGAVADSGTTLVDANLSVSIGLPGNIPDAGYVSPSFGGTDGTSLPVDHLSAGSISAALNSVAGVITAGGVDCEDVAPGCWLVTARSAGVIAGDPSFNAEAASPAAYSETTEIRTGDSDTRAQWLIRLTTSPVAAIAGGSWSSTSSGTFSNALTATLTLSTTGLAGAVARGQRDFFISIIHAGHLLHRSALTIDETLDPSGAGALTIVSPAYFSIDSNAITQNQNILLSGLTFDGTTLTSTGGGGGVSWVDAPASAGASGTAGELAYAANYLYVCVATNTWRRAILSTWS